VVDGWSTAAVDRCPNNQALTGGRRRLGPTPGCGQLTVFGGRSNRIVRHIDCKNSEIHISPIYIRCLSIYPSFGGLR
jgi:hypothetical protein